VFVDWTGARTAGSVCVFGQCFPLDAARYRTRGDIDDDARMQEQQRQGTELVFEALRKLMETFKAERLIVTIDTCECFNEPGNEGAWLALTQRMREARLLRAIGDVQRQKRDIQAATESYQKALVLFRGNTAEFAERTLQKKTCAPVRS
jgi:hypothetical protein